MIGLFRIHVVAPVAYCKINEKCFSSFSFYVLLGKLLHLDQLRAYVTPTTRLQKHGIVQTLPLPRKFAWFLRQNVQRIGGIVR